MRLAVDIGNSSTKYGLFSKGELIKTGAGSEEPVYIIKSIYDENPDIDAIVISSVNSAIDAENIPLPETIHHLILESDTAVPFENLYRTPESLGHDRIALAAAATLLFPGRNSLIIDAGTCITYDLVNDKRQYLGGLISPGIQLRLNALNQGTARLPLVKNPETLPRLIGNSTESCIESGVVNGILSELRDTINRFENEFNDLQPLLTGGSASIFAGELKSGIFANPNLVLLGLHEILRYNIEKK